MARKGCDSPTRGTKASEVSRNDSPPCKRSNNKVLNETVSLLAQSTEETIDTLIKTMLQASASFINCTGGSNADNPTNLSRGDIEEVVQALQTSNGDYFMEGMYGSLKFGSSPIMEAYMAMGSTRLLPNLRQVDGWKDKLDYPREGHSFTSEVGSVSNVRVCLSSGGVVVPNSSALGADVYSLFITAQQSYTCIKQSGFSAKFMYVPPVPSAADPAGLRQYGSARFAQAQVITNNAWIINLRSTLA